VRLTRLRLSDFLAYADLDLDLDGVGQLAIIGPNGAGKSTLLDAVLWSLYGQARGRADQLIREGAERTLVETTWFHPVEGVVTVRRTRGDDASTLTLTVNGVNRTRHTLPDTQAAIEAIIGLPYRALLAGPIMVQGESDALMSVTPSERKELLAKLFELDRYEVFHQRAKEKAAEAAAVADEARRTAARLQEVVDEELPVRALRRDATSAVAEHRAKVAEADSRVVLLREEAISLRERAARVDEVRRVLATADQQLDRSTATLADLDAQVVAHRTVAAATPNSVPAETFAKLDELEIITRDFLASSDKARLVENVPCKGEGIYASCRFLTDAEAALVRLPQLEELVLALGGPKPIERIVAERNEYRAQEREAVRVTERRDTAQRWLEREPVVRRSLEEQIELAKTQVRESKATLGTLELDIARASQVTTDLGAAVDDLKMAQGFLEANLADLARAEERLKAIDSAKVGLSQARETEQVADGAATLYGTLARAFGRDGIPTLILENGIPLIEDRANEILARMPGGFAVNLITQRETKAGTTRDTLDVLVVADGRERAYSLLSGGERLRVDFALRVGLSAVLVERSRSTAFGTLFIDETFSSQDREGREAMLQAVAAVADDFGLIMVTSHIEEITDRFDTKLIVSKDAGGVSTAEIVG
jgi:exonuclease SbcC